MSVLVTLSTSMSKTYDGNWMQAARAFWKRSAESGTVWLNKYRYDPFFRTEINVIGLQVAFGLVILGLVGTSYSLLYHDITVAIVNGIRDSIANHTIQGASQTVIHQTE